MNDFGLTAGIPDERYHGATEVLSSTGARKVLACPARFRWERANPPGAKRAFDFGKLAHRLVLGEGPEICVVDAPDWRSKAAQEQRNAAYAAGLVPVLAAEFEAAGALRDSVYAHDTARDLFKAGAAELSGFWTDEATGTALRFRPDWMTRLDGRPVCVDVKTTVSADPKEFGRSVLKFGYHQQARWYLDGLHAHSVEGARFLFVAVEKQPPYCVSVIELDGDALAEGARLNRKAIDLYARCIESGIWPAYGHHIHTISLPPWAARAAVQADADLLISQLEGITA